jgi:hypothetical protein
MPKVDADLISAVAGETTDDQVLFLQDLEQPTDLLDG